MLEVNNVYVGDSLELLKHIDDGSIDCVITDPPYMVSDNIKVNRVSNKNMFDRWLSFRYNDEIKSWDYFSSLDEYLEFTYKWVDECYRVLRLGGHLLVFFDKFKVSYLISYCEKLGFKARQCLFWLKTNPVPQARKVKFMEALEMICWFTKGTVSRKHAVFNFELGQHPNYYRHPICSGKERKEGGHPTQKPVRLIEWLISYLTKENELILDPFCGSGSVLVAASRLGRRYIGIEINGVYVERARARLQQLHLPKNSAS